MTTPSKPPYLHVRAPKRIVGVGGEGDRPVAKLCATRAGLLKLRGQRWTGRSRRRRA